MDQITKNAVISAMIVAKMNQGMDIRQAIDAVLGEGMYMKIASDVYHQLRGE